MKERKKSNHKFKGKPKLGLSLLSATKIWNLYRSFLILNQCVRYSNDELVLQQ